MFEKFQNLPTNQNSLPLTPRTLSYSRKIPSNGPLLERTQEFHNSNNGFQNQSKPFQIKIDTQFIHRDSGPPMTQTTTTFVDKNLNAPPPSQIYPLSESNLTSRCYSPIKINNQTMDSGRPSLEAVIKPGTIIGDQVYSPYHGRSSRLN